VAGHSDRLSTRSPTASTFADRIARFGKPWSVRLALPGDDSLVFIGPKNGPLRRSNFSGIWRSAAESAGLAGFHFHDLRHTGNHIAAATGASLRELMGRMGHSTTRAALIYQHRTADRDRLIASVMSEIVEAELSTADEPSGTQRARGENDDSDAGREGS
jgi:integrase